jgi:purine-nucleoside phosphorylase
MSTITDGLAARPTKIDAAAGWIRSQWNVRPRAAIVLGTGMGRFAEQIEIQTTLPYESIPHFRCTSAPGHRGRLLCGSVGGLPVVAMDGRFHAYEGCTSDEIGFPIRVLHALGIETLIVTNAAGGLNPRFQTGDIMLIADHINLIVANPLTAASLWRGDARREVYTALLIDRARQAAERAGFVAHQGVYIAVHGPNYETRAEYRFLRAIGGDAVGMSTVPEVLISEKLGLPVLGISTITNLGLSEEVHETTCEEVITAAESAGPKVAQIILGVLNALPCSGICENSGALRKVI